MGREGSNSGSAEYDNASYRLLETSEVAGRERAVVTEGLYLHNMDTQFTKGVLGPQGVLNLERLHDLVNRAKGR